MPKNKKPNKADFNASEMSFTKFGFYDDGIDLPDSYARYYFTPENTEVSGDFYLVAKCIMDKILQSYHTITCIQSLNPKPCFLQKHCVYEGVCHFTARYYEFSEAHGLTENMFLDGADKIIILDKGLNAPITKLSIECIDIAGTPKECCSYVVYGYKKLPLVKSLSEAKSFIESMTYELLIEYGKHPDYLSVTFNRSTLDIGDIIETIRSICDAHNKILRVDLT